MTVKAVANLLDGFLIRKYYFFIFLAFFHCFLRTWAARNVTRAWAATTQFKNPPANQDFLVVLYEITIEDPYPILSCKFILKNTSYL
jgi:hypothetical protein